jgi:cytochrome c oxidase assembly factor CtaG
MLAAASSAFLFGLFNEPAAAAQSRHLSQLQWNWDPLILISLGFAGFGYVCGLRRLDKTSRLRLFGRTRSAAFASGIAILFAALISPFDALDDQLFSAHMVQHLVLLMVAPPLLILGRPTVAWLWAFPLPARRVIGRVWIKSGLHRLVQQLMSPIVVWILCTAALWFWHLPGPYGWALANESVHALEHVCFFVTAIMFWTMVIEPFGRRRLGYGAALLFVATMGMQNGLLGALLTFAGRPLYMNYLHTTAVWGLTPLEDQQLSGLIMWIPASLIHLTTLCVLFVAWLRAAEGGAIITKANAYASEGGSVLRIDRAGADRLNGLVLSRFLLVNGTQLLESEKREYEPVPR